MDKGKKIIAVKISPQDNVVTVLSDVNASDVVEISGQSKIDSIIAQENCPYGHKIALEDIKQGSPIYKYGEIIGFATQDIQKGHHVHTQNLDSFRGRGDTEVGMLNPSTHKVADQSHSFCQNTSLLKSETYFMGYHRADGQVGTRNHVGVISTVACANDAAIRIAAKEDCPCFTHQQGCSQTKPDVAKVLEVLVNLAHNPNLGAVIFVCLGCESVPIPELKRQLQDLEKPFALLTIQDEGGLQKTVFAGQKIVKEFKEKVKDQKREKFPISKLKVGLKCGSSDTTQGLSANVVIGRITDELVKAGASVIIGETTEFMGAEHIAAKNALEPEIGQKIISAVKRMEDRAKAVGVDMRGGQPTRGNIEGGLTTIEEKSLGALAKAGTSKYCDFVDYGTKPTKTGLVFMDSPGREPEMLTGLASAGCNLILFSTGRGAPQGFPFVPVIKISGNPRTSTWLQEHIDVTVSEVMNGNETIGEAAQRLLTNIVEVADGKLTKAEICGYNNSMNIYVRGPVI